jgi:hypothetical protein
MVVLRRWPGMFCLSSYGVVFDDCVTAERSARAEQLVLVVQFGTHGMLNCGRTRRSSLTTGGALQQRRARDLVRFKDLKLWLGSGNTGLKQAEGR